MKMLTINIHVEDSMIIVTHRDVWTRCIYIYNNNNDNNNK